MALILIEKFSSSQVIATDNLHTKAMKYWDKSGQLFNEEYSILCSL